MANCKKSFGIIVLALIVVVCACVGLRASNNSAQITAQAYDLPSGTEGVDWGYIGATTNGVAVADGEMGKDVVWYFSGTKLIFEGIGAESRSIKDNPGTDLGFYQKITAYNILPTGYAEENPNCSNTNEIEFKNIKRIGSNTINGIDEAEDNYDHYDPYYFPLIFPNGLYVTFDNKLEEIGANNFKNIIYLDKEGNHTLTIPASVKRIEEKGLGFRMKWLKFLDNAGVPVPSIYENYKQNCYLKPDYFTNKIKFLGVPEYIADNFLEETYVWDWEIYANHIFAVEFPNDWPVDDLPKDFKEVPDLYFVPWMYNRQGVRGYHITYKVALWHNIYLSQCDVKFDVPEVTYGDASLTGKSFQVDFDLPQIYGDYASPTFITQFTIDNSNIIRSNTNKMADGAVYTKGGVSISPITSSFTHKSLDGYSTYDFFDTPKKYGISDSTTKTQLALEKRTFLLLNTSSDDLDAGYYFIPYNLELRFGNTSVSTDEMYLPTTNIQVIDGYITVQVKQKPLFVTGCNVAQRQYNGVNDTSVNVTGTPKLDANSILAKDVGKVNVDFSSCTFSFVDGNAGNSKPITMVGATLSGERAFNYTFDGCLTGKITQKPISFKTDTQYIDKDPSSYGVAYQPQFIPTEDSIIEGDVVNPTIVYVINNHPDNFDKSPYAAIETTGNLATMLGNYTAYLGAIDNPNYSIPTAYNPSRYYYSDGWYANAIKIPFVVQMASYKVTTAPTVAEGLVYDGTPQTLISTAGTAEGGTMQYSLDGKTWDTKFVTGTDAGTYKVYYRVKGDDSHGDSQPVELSVTIAKADVTNVTAPTAITLYANGNDQQLVNAGSSTQGTLEYSLDGTTWASKIPTGKEKGTYTVYYRVKGDKNHNDLTDASFTVDVTIYPPFAEFDAPTAKEGVAYGGTAVEIADAGSSTQGTMKYYLSATQLDDPTEITSWSDDVTTIKANASGTYYVYYYCEGDANHSSSEISCLEVAVPVLITESPFTVSSVTYTGEAVSPILTQSATSYVEGTDFDIVFDDATDHKNVGDNIPFKVVFKGDYAGTLSLSFAITAKSLNENNVASIADRQYTGSAIQPTLVITDGDYTLVKGTDYTVEYTNNTSLGDATATITLCGNYTGTITKTFKIVAKDVTATGSGVAVSTIANQTYNMSEITPVIEVKDGNTTLNLNTDYTVTYSNNTNAGTATVTVTFKGNYTGTLSANFTIVAKDVTETSANVAISTIAEQTYVASGCTPVIEVKDGEKVLTLGTDYTVTYSNNTSVGTATATATFKGNYTGTLSANFTIVAKDVTATSANVAISDIENQAYDVSGCTPVIEIKDGEKVLTLGTDYEVAYSDNTGVGTATVTVTFKGNYTGTLTKTFVITKRAITVTIDSKTSTYGDAIVALTATDSETINEGSAIYSLSTTATATSNVGSYDITGTVLNDNYDITFANETGAYVIAQKEVGLSWSTLTAEQLVYDGTAKTLTATATGLVGEDGCDVTVAITSGKNNTNAGKFTFTAQSLSNDNYKLPTNVTSAEYTITKASLTVTAKDKTIKYNQDPANDGVTYDGFVGEETSAVLGGTIAYGYSYENGDDAGEYTITPSGLTSDNYEITFVDGQLTVEKADQVIIITDASKVYDGSIVYVYYTKSGAGTATVEYKQKGQDDVEYSTNSPKYGGTYVVRVSVDECDNYLSGVEEQEFTISKATVSTVGMADVTAPVANATAEVSVSGLPMDGKHEGTITWSPSLVDGKFDYNTTYTATITLTMAGQNNSRSYKFDTEATIRLKGKAPGVTNGWTKSGNSTEDTLIYTKTFEITGKVPQSLEITVDITKDYDGTAVSAPTFTKLGDGNVTIEYKLASQDDTAYTTTAPTSAGNYVVRVTVDATDTHLGDNVTAEFSINKVKVTLPTAKTNLVYNGTEQTGVVLAQDGLFTLENNTATNAGSYTAVATLVDTDNYEWNLTTPTADNQQIDWEIAQLSITNATVVFDESKVYDGTTQTFAVTSVTVGDLVVTFDVTGNTAKDYSADGYTLTITANGDFVGTITKNFAIDRVTVEMPTADTTEFTYTGEAQTYNLAESDLYEITNNVQTEEGEYVVTVSLLDTNNYAWADGTTQDLTFTFVIEKENVANVILLILVIKMVIAMAIFVCLVAYSERKK